MRTLGRGRFANNWFMGLMAFVVAPFVTVPVHAQDYRALVAAPDRSAADRENDKRRDPTGMLYGQTPPDQFERARQAFDARAKSPAMKNAVQDVRPFDDPVPPGVRDLD